jgi:O-methyltransferase/8-demethyl-8-(2,3-dimethoxy-alpha-L-rhamnosyl)tetracenomycin-C 4'-O-methyltransferase
VRPERVSAEDRCRTLYLDLLEQTLTGALWRDIGFVPAPDAPCPALAGVYDAQRRFQGLDWPQHACTMIGLCRLRHLRQSVERVIEDVIPGDFIETGVWRGGACIYMRALLAAYDIKDRRVWVADSFAGLPPPTPEKFPDDAGSELHKIGLLAVSIDEVKNNFAKYNMLDEQVVFLKGWFKDTLPAAPIERLAILRLDGDLYESTIQVLEALYDRVSPGGFVIIDDYMLPACRKAVEDFRAKKNILQPVEEMEAGAGFWRRK